MGNTIVAIATASGKSGVAIVRMSGQKSLEILKKLTGKTDFVPRMMTLCRVKTAEFDEKALCVYFAAPNSFTGEDCVEVQCHGGMYIATSIVNQCLSLGATHAGAGEFSLRAFEHGKIKLAEAESLIDMINSESVAQVKLASANAFGKLTATVVELQNTLKNIVAEIIAIIDYPEYDIDIETTVIMSRRVQSVIEQLAKIINTFATGRVVREGVNIGIIGAPNVGKSSLLNALTDSDAAIVSDIAGTTRDVVKSKYVYRGVVFNIFDTAGIRESEDTIERIGVERARKMINECDIILSLENKEIPAITFQKDKVINVKTKSDIYDYGMIENAIACDDYRAIERLKGDIYFETIKADINSSEQVITNSRHNDCLLRAKKILELAQYDLDNGGTYDIISAMINNAWSVLGEITGETANIEIINTIFSKFCLGK